MWPAIITALATILISAGTFFLTKQAEREAVWRSKKLSYYEEFFGAGSGILGDNTPREAQIRFATAVNNLHLVGSPGVIRALHDFLDEISVSNMNPNQITHDRLWSLLVWEIRADLNDAPSKEPANFKARLWASGVGRNS